VASRHSQVRDVLGMWFLIQSPNKGCSHIRNSLDKHLQEMSEKVEKISNEDFETQVEALMTLLAEKDKNQEETFGRDWNEFATHKYLFERQDIEIAELKTITKEEFKDYFNTMFVVENHKRLDIHFNA
jgi:insulysin